MKAFATIWIRRRLWSEEEREAGLAALAMGTIGITEGAIPFAAADPLRIKRRCARVVHPQAAVLPAAWIPTEEDDRLIGWHAVGCALSRDLMHLDVLAAQYPFERHVMSGFVARDGASQHPVTDQPIE